MQRFLPLAAAALLTGCTWGRSTARDCSDYQANAASEALERAAAAKGIREVELTHALCSSKLERLAGLRAGRAEVGWCAAVRERVPATAAAVRSAAAAQCAEALRRGVVYANWDTVVGDEFFFVAGDYKQIGPLFPRGVPQK
jgi:hypothetical protein